MLKADLSKGPAGQSRVRVYMGGESRGEKVREVTPVEGGRVVSLNRSYLSQSPGEVTSGWPSDWFPLRPDKDTFPFG